MEGICPGTCLTCLGGIPYAQWPLELTEGHRHGTALHARSTLPRPLSKHPDPCCWAEILGRVFGLERDLFAGCRTPS